MCRRRYNYTLSLYEKALPPFLTLEEKLLRTKENGFDALELSIDESAEKQKRLFWRDKEIRALSEIANRCQVPIQTICLSAHRKHPLGSHDPAIRAAGMEIVKRAVDFASRAGIRIIQLAGYDVYYENSDLETKRYFVEGLYAAVEYAASAGVMLAFETMETAFMDTIGKARFFVEMCGSPFLQLYPDVGNLCNAYIKYGIRAEDDIENGVGHIVAAHLKETKPGKYRDMAFGTGQTDYLTCIQALWSQGVRRYTAEYWYLGEEDWQERLGNASAFLRQRIETAAERARR